MGAGESYKTTLLVNDDINIGFAIGLPVQSKPRQDGPLIWFGQVVLTAGSVCPSQMDQMGGLKLSD